MEWLKIQMTPRQIVDALEEIAKSLKIEVRRDRLESNGGICYLEEKPLIVLNKLSPFEAQAQTLAAALANFDLENVPMKPVVRKYFEDILESINQQPPA
jgi:hypothetical protein